MTGATTTTTTTTTITTDDLLTALRARDRGAINGAAAKLLDQKAQLGGEWFSIAQVLVRTGEITLALSAAQRGVEQSRQAEKAKFQLAHLLSMVGQQEEAIAIASKLVPGQVNSVELDHFLATCALELGDFEPARSGFERVLDARPGSGVTWLSLAALPPIDDSALLKRLNAARSAIRSTPLDSRARWHYAKGTILDRLEKPDEAFSEFFEGAELVKSLRPYDRDADRREAEKLIADFDEAAITRISDQVTTGTGRPILVTGLPRSGTTLVEQILASHGRIAGGGELPFASILAREIGGQPAAMPGSDAGGPRPDELATLYLHLGDQQFGDGQRFVDKSLSASRHLGVLASVLPEAPIVWLRRDPLDCAWSCFRTFFSQGCEWSWSLTDIAAHFRLEDKLFEHWRGILGPRLLTVSYDELASYPESQIERILDHLGLEADLAAEEAHLNRRAVTTASVAQVRRPIYGSSVGASRPYHQQLKPFTEAYDGASSSD